MKDRHESKREPVYKASAAGVYVCCACGWQGSSYNPCVGDATAEWKRHIAESK